MKPLSSLTYTFVLFVFFASLPKSSDAFQILFESDAGGLGELIDGESSGMFSVPGIANLEFNILSVGSLDPGTAIVNATGSSFGVDIVGKTGTEGDDADQFDAGFSEFATFSFSQALSVTEIDFAGFGGAESFQFGSQSILGADSNLSQSVFTFETPLFLAANEQFTLRATDGTIGLQSITVAISAVPEPTTLVGFSVMGMIVTLGRRKRRVKVC